MKKIVFFVLGAAIFACKNDTDSQTESMPQQTTVDSLPDGEWNGEYIAVKDSLAEEKKPKKQSRGAEYFNMGTVEVTVDTMEFSIDLFDQKKNHLTINRNSLVMRIKSAQRDYVSIQLKKPDILNEPLGTYQIDADGSKPTSSAVDFNRLSLKNRTVVNMISGSTTLKSFSPRLGKVELEAKGTFEDRDGNKYPGKVFVKMRFESVVSTYNPNS